MFRFSIVFHENVVNGIYAPWWAGLAQKVKGAQVRWFWGWDDDNDGYDGDSEDIHEAGGLAGE